MHAVSKGRKRARVSSSEEGDAPHHARGKGLDPAEILHDCQRRLRCCLAALRLESPAQLSDLINPTKENIQDHVLAPVTAGCHCHFCGRSAAESRQACRHKKSHMQSTKNSKRSVHTFLKWVSLVGPNFPVTDTMLQDVFWKNLDPMCEYGVRYAAHFVAGLLTFCCHAIYFLTMKTRKWTCETAWRACVHQPAPLQRGQQRGGARPAVERDASPCVCNARICCGRKAVHGQRRPCKHDVLETSGAVPVCRFALYPP